MQLGLKPKLQQPGNPTSRKEVGLPELEFGESSVRLVSTQVRNLNNPKENPNGSTTVLARKPLNWTERMLAKPSLPDGEVLAAGDPGEWQLLLAIRHARRLTRTYAAGQPATGGYRVLTGTPELDALAGFWAGAVTGSDGPNLEEHAMN